MGRRPQLQEKKMSLLIHPGAAQAKSKSSHYSIKYLDNFINQKHIYSSREEAQKTVDAFSGANVYEVVPVESFDYPVTVTGKYWREKKKKE